MGGLPGPDGAGNPPNLSRLHGVLAGRLAKRLKGDITTMRMSGWKTLMLGAAVMLTAAACDDNPVDEGVDEVARLDFSRGYASVAPGDSITIQVTPENRYQDPVSASLDVTACDNRITIGSVERDEVELIESWNVVVHGTNNLGFSCFEARAAGVVDTVDVLVVPPTLLMEATEAAPGTQVVIERAPGQPVFDENTAATINFAPAFWLRSQSTPDSLVLVLPRALDPGDYPIEVTGLGAGDATLTTDPLTIAGDPPADEAEPNDSPATAPHIDEFPLEIIGTTSADDADDFYTYTVPEDVTVEFWLEWDNVAGSPDLDFYGAVDPAFTTTFCGGAFTGSYPEHIGPCELAAGEYMVYVNEWTPSDGTTYHLYMEIVEE